MTSSAIPLSVAPEHTAVNARLTDQDRADIERFKSLAPGEMLTELQMAVVACYLHMGRPREQAA